MRASSTSSTPELNAFDVVMLIVGVVLGAGIFALPALVAANTGTAGSFLGAWVFGGAISLAGALCYAELATAYPHAGGEHHFLRRAFGRGTGVLFAWSRLAVLQTGSIAIQAFIVGDYLARMIPWGERSADLLAAIAVVFITAINVAGIRSGKWTQVLLGLATCTGLLAVTSAGLIGPAAVETVAAAGSTGAAQASAEVTRSFGLAMVFVLLAYGGWNEAAYVSAEVSRRNLVRALFWGIGTITAIYLLVNFAYLRGLGMEGVMGSRTLAADLVERVAGVELGTATGAIIAIAALSTMNATTITGARSHYALGREVPLLAGLGRRTGSEQSPANALLVQGAIAFALVLFGAATRSGFTALVEYTAPVFWLFFGLVGVSVFVLRRRDPQRSRPFQVPLYPLTPLLFCAACAYMIRSSIAHTGLGALVGVAVLLLGLPLVWLARGGPVSSSVLHETQTDP